jgi:hypothetical protein
MIRSRGILKTKRLLIVNCFLKRAMEESIFDVDLVNRPLRRNGYTEYCANGARLNNRRESFIIVNPMLLRQCLHQEGEERAARCHFEEGQKTPHAWQQPNFGLGVQFCRF